MTYLKQSKPNFVGVRVSNFAGAFRISNINRFKHMRPPVETRSRSASAYLTVAGCVMKMVIAVGQISEIEDSLLRKLGYSVRNLISDSNKLTLIQELGRQPSRAWRASGRVDQSPHGGGVESSQLKPLYRDEIREDALSVALHAASVVTFMISGLDGQILRLRRCGNIMQASANSFEVGAVLPFWIDLIGEKSAVPVLLNEGIGFDGTRCMLDAVQLATACAVGWDADALIVLDSDEGVRDRGGSVRRWLELEQRDRPPDSHSQEYERLNKVRACSVALRAGVRRARILPWSHIDCLEDFFRAKISFGTEVVLSDVCIDHKSDRSVEIEPVSDADDKS